MSLKFKFSCNFSALQLNNLVSAGLFRPIENHMRSETIAKVEEETGKNETEELEDEKSCCDQAMPYLKEQFQILTNLTFLIYCCQIFAMSICIQTFLTYLVSFAVEFGNEKFYGSLLISVVGLSDMAGRFIFGFVFDHPRIRKRRRLFFAYLGLPVGFLCIFMGFLTYYPFMMVIGVIYGIVEGGFHSQRATIVSEFVTKDKMSSTVGLVIFFQGLGNLAGVPVAGMIVLLNFIHISFHRYCYDNNCIIYYQYISSGFSL